jgi:hypothetical protein
MVIEGVKQFQEKESLIAALKIIAWVRRTAYKEKAFRLQNHMRNCWPLAKAANNGGHHSSRCPGGLAFASGLHARQVGEVAWLKAGRDFEKLEKVDSGIFSGTPVKNSHQWASRTTCTSIPRTTNWPYRRIGNDTFVPHCRA